MAFRTLPLSGTSFRGGLAPGPAHAAAQPPARSPYSLRPQRTAAAARRRHPARPCHRWRSHPSPYARNLRRNQSDERRRSHRAILSLREEARRDCVAPSDSPCTHSQQLSRRVQRWLFACARLAHASGVAWHPDRNGVCLSFSILTADRCAKDFHGSVRGREGINENPVGAEACRLITNRFQNVSVSDVDRVSLSGNESNLIVIVRDFVTARKDGDGITAGGGERNLGIPGYDLGFCRAPEKCGEADQRCAAEHTLIHCAAFVQARGR